MHRARSGHLACAPVPYSGVLWREASRVILSDKIRYAGGLREDRTWQRSQTGFAMRDRAANKPEEPLDAEVVLKPKHNEILADMNAESESKHSVNIA